MRITMQFNVGILYSRIERIRNAARQGLAEGALRGAELVRDEAKRIVPVDTGLLRDSIHTEHSKDFPTRQEHVVTPVYPAENKYGFEPPYARRIEYGFVGYDSMGRFYNQPPKPYMRPAYETKREEAKEAVEQAIRSAVAEAR